MADRKDVLMTQVISAFAKGCNGAEIADEAADWFHDRYYRWLDSVKSTGERPMDVWPGHGKLFMEKFRQIGEQAAAGGGTVTADSLTAAATSIETDSECPYCPIKP